VISEEILILLAKLFFAVVFATGVFNFVLIELLFFLPDIKKVLRSKFVKNHPNPDIIGKVIDTYGNPLSFAKIVLLERKSKRKISKISDGEGKFTFKVRPGDYEVHLQQFGYKLRYSPDFELQPSQGLVRLSLDAQQTEQIMIDPPIISYIEVAKVFFAILFVLGFVLMTLTFYFSKSMLFLPIGLCLVLLAYLFSYSNFVFIKVFDHHGKPIKNSPVEIKDRKNLTIAQIKTDQHGRLRIVASTGFYKLTSQTTLFKTFRLDQKSIVDLDLSL
jgi:hypothetical protein